MSLDDELIVKPLTRCKYCGEDEYPCDCQDRIDCKSAGEAGHHQCGICSIHNQPRIKCGCLLFNDRIQKKWQGTWPAKCDICGLDLSKDPWFVDGRVVGSSWALMCIFCFETSGYGLGTGLGQKYDSKTLIKLEG